MKVKCLFAQCLNTLVVLIVLCAGCFFSLGTGTALAQSTPALYGYIQEYNEPGEDEGDLSPCPEIFFNIDTESYGTNWEVTFTPIYSPNPDAETVSMEVTSGGNQELDVYFYPPDADDGTTYSVSIQSLDDPSVSYPDYITVTAPSLDLGEDWAAYCSTCGCVFEFNSDALACAPVTSGSGYAFGYRIAGTTGGLIMVPVNSDLTVNLYDLDPTQVYEWVAVQGSTIPDPSTNSAIATFLSRNQVCVPSSEGWDD